MQGAEGEGDGGAKGDAGAVLALGREALGQMEVALALALPLTERVQVPHPEALGV